MIATDVSDALASESQEWLERAVAGSAMRSAEAADALSLIIGNSRGAFMVPRYALVFEAAVTLAGRGEPVDETTVLHELTRTGTLQQAGGGPGVHDCQHAAPPDARWHARKIAAEARRRGAINALERAVLLLREPGFDPLTGFDLARKLASEGLDAPGGEQVRPAGRLFEDVIGQLERGAEHGLRLPWHDLNRLIPGLGPGELVIVAARPSVGKSLIGGAMAAFTAIDLGRPALLVSLEMSAEGIMLRLISAAARVPLALLVSSRVSDDRDWERIRRSHAGFADAPLLIDDTPGCSVTHIRSQLTAMQRSGNPAALLIVDYVQLLASPDTENRNVAVGAVSQHLKRIAREFAIPAVVLAQLNRGPEHRSDHRPVLSDLRDSGQLEADADVVILLHRDEMYDRESASAGEIELIVAKQRQGPLGTVTLGFQGEFARCVDLARAVAS